MGKVTSPVKKELVKILNRSSFSLSAGLSREAVMIELYGLGNWRKTGTDASDSKPPHTPVYGFPTISVCNAPVRGVHFIHPYSSHPARAGTLLQVRQLSGCPEQVEYMGCYLVWLVRSPKLPVSQHLTPSSHLEMSGRNKTFYRRDKNFSGWSKLFYAILRDILFSTKYLSISLVSMNICFKVLEKIHQSPG